MGKKRKCRYTPEEAEIHAEAVRLRKMTDEQLVTAFRATTKAAEAHSTADPTNDTNGIKTLIEGLAKGECKGIKGATAYKVAEYAEAKGLI